MDRRKYARQNHGSDYSCHPKSGLSFRGKPIDFKLTNLLGMPLREERRYQPYFSEKCQTCGMRIICNGCTRCGKCEPK